jgi:hypothetical protein
MRIHVEKKTVLIVLAVVAVVLMPLALGQAQSMEKRGEFVRAMRAGRVTQFPPYLADKVWSDADLATTTVRKIPSPYRRHTLGDSLHRLAGGHTLPGTAYGFQAAVVDTSTGMRYWFGRSRQEPGRWTWAGIHPDSMARWIEQRGAEAAAMEGKRVAPLPER